MMKYLEDLEKIININSYTKNKKGVDAVGQIMSTWLKELGFNETTYKRDEIGIKNRRKLKSFSTVISEVFGAKKYRIAGNDQELFIKTTKGLLLAKIGAKIARIRRKTIPTKPILAMKSDLKRFIASASGEFD